MSVLENNPKSANIGEPLQRFQCVCRLHTVENGVIQDYYFINAFYSLILPFWKRKYLKINAGKYIY